MTGIRVAHTADLDAATLEEARALLFEVFTGDDAMTDEDWEHCVGGMHALAYDGGEVVGHASRGDAPAPARRPGAAGRVRRGGGRAW